MTCPCSLGQECNCGFSIRPDNMMDCSIVGNTIVQDACSINPPPKQEDPLAFYVGVRNALAVTAVVAAVCAALALCVL